MKTPTANDNIGWAESSAWNHIPEFITFISASGISVIRLNTFKRRHRIRKNRPYKSKLSGFLNDAGAI